MFNIVRTLTAFAVLTGVALAPNTSRAGDDKDVLADILKQVDQQVCQSP
ncbi:MAG: hypothetical protein IH923_03290, partial [Nitrospinae bacterium]|nr:hypothetical protein [Nitrospinota bacterium]